MTGCVLLISFAIPAFAASSDYNFTLNYRVVDGKENGEFHSLDSGKVKIEGSTNFYNSEIGAVGPNDIKYTLYRDAWGFDPSFGTVNGGINEDFSAYFPSSADEGSDSYYLFIYKVEDDGHDVKGSGTLSN